MASSGQREPEHFLYRRANRRERRVDRALDREHRNPLDGAPMIANRCKA